MTGLKIRDLVVKIDGKDVINELDLDIAQGELAVLMGPNGSGKSSLAQAIMGHPDYEVSGRVLLDGVDVLSLKPHERASAGLFLGFQYPMSIPGVPLTQFLRLAYNSLHADQTKSVLEFKDFLAERVKLAGLSAKFLNRNLNEGFSGGEKKKAEVLQMLVLEPKFAILDEVDSGLDLDGHSIVASNINRAVKGGMGALVVTHNPKLLENLDPASVHILIDGKIKKSGDKSLVLALESNGYEQFK